MNQPSASSEVPRWDQVLHGLRGAFDTSFAQAAALAAPVQEDMLAIGAGDVDLALPLAGITRLEPRRRLATLNGGAPALLGLCGVRGQLVPVFSLAHLVGAKKHAIGDPWVVLVGAQAPIGLAFDRFEGFLRVDTRSITDLAPFARTPFAQRVLAGASTARQVVDIDGVLKMISAQAAPPAGLAIKE
jgi:chemotaxis signal transduction protein